MRHRLCVPALFAVSTVLAPAAIALAQPQAGGAGPTPQGQPINPASDDQWRFRMDLSGRAEFRADLRDVPGDVAIYRAGGDLSIGYVGVTNFRFGLDLGIEESWYDFRNATTLVPGTGDPLGATTRIEIDPTIGWQIDENWGILAGVMLGFAFENGADIGDSFTGGGLFGVRYRFNNDFSLTLGVIASSQLEDDWQVFPLLGVEWKITPEVTLSTRGLGLELAAQFAPQWRFLAWAVYETRDYRLDESGPLPSGVARDARLPIGLGVEYSPCQSFSIRLEGGVVAWQEFTFDNAAGVRVGQEEGKFAPMLGLRGTFRF